MEWCLPGSTRERRPQNSNAGMKKTEINNMECIDREEWRRNTKLKHQAQKDEGTQAKGI